MSDIVLLDTSIYLNVLDIPGLNQGREEIIEGFRVSIGNGDHFLLPLAVVWETGNHIADLDDGRLRREYASILVADVRNAFNREFSPDFLN